MTGLSVVRGQPDDDELAALVVVVAARSRTAEPGHTSRRSLWASRSRQVRPPLHPSPGAWRASSLPR